MFKKIVLVAALASNSWIAAAQSTTQPASLVNVFLGSSGDHGQMSPGAGSPFGMMSLAPQTYPNLHMGYEHNAKKFLGFTHNRFEGVGCTGSGGLLLIKPFSQNAEEDLLKSTEDATPGYYHVSFENKIDVKLSASDKSGIHQYTFPSNQKNLYVDFAHAFSGGFVAEEHQVTATGITGWIEARTTCGPGRYKTFFAIDFGQKGEVKDLGNHRIAINFSNQQKELLVKVGFSTVDAKYAKVNVPTKSFEELKSAVVKDWNEKLNTINVDGDVESQKLFYSLLYRTMQSPYLISEQDGSYKKTNGEVAKSKQAFYNGWAIWDNYRTQLPLLSLVRPAEFQLISNSIAGMYANGKKDYATRNEPSNTVRTEHASAVLLDASSKGFKVDFARIADSLVADEQRLDFSKPDKALESSYDEWTLAQIFKKMGKKDLYEKYITKASEYKKYWEKDFKDITKNDIDRMQARGLYQGTIWQYRWFVPFDVKGLVELCGGEEEYLKQLEYFYKNDLYNHANEPDLQVPMMFNVTQKPWMSQKWMYNLANDTVVQYYFNDNSRGIDPFVNRIYRNEPATYVRTMDDDAGAMSGWYVFTASGMMPALVGTPNYYLNVPLFKSVTYNFPNGKKWKVSVENFSHDNKYIQQVKLNGKVLDRNWITHQEITAGGTLEITASKEPNKSFGTKNQLIPSLRD